MESELRAEKNLRGFLTYLSVILMWNMSGRLATANIARTAGVDIADKRERHGITEEVIICPFLHHLVFYVNVLII